MITDPIASIPMPSDDTVSTGFYQVVQSNQATFPHKFQSIEYLRRCDVIEISLLIHGPQRFTVGLSQGSGNLCGWGIGSAYLRWE